MELKRRFVFRDASSIYPAERRQLKCYIITVPASSESKLSNALRRALYLHEGGDLAAAERCYREVVASETNSGVAHHALGLLLAESGRYEESEQALRKAVCLNPVSVTFRCSLATVQISLGRPNEALQSFEFITSSHPDHVDSIVGHAICLRRLDNPADCLTLLRKAVLIDPLHLEANRQLAVSLMESLQDAEAINVLRETLRYHPKDIAARIALADALIRQENYAEALHVYQIAASLSPQNPDVQNGRCVVLHRLGRLHEAAAAGEIAVRLDSNPWLACFNLGNIYCDLGAFTKACELYERAICLNPTYAEAFYNLGNARLELKDPDKAIACFDQALAIRPDYLTANWNKCMSLLSSGRYSEGWPLYEFRWQLPGSREEYRSTKPRWTGTEGLRGKTLLLIAEQGLGDTIQFSRFAAALKLKGASVVLLAPRRLHDLLKKVQGIDSITHNPPPDNEIDFWCPLLSVPLALRTTLDNLPTRTPYIAAEASRIEKWKKTLGSKTNLRVGVAWSGSPTNAKDHARSIPFQLLSKLLPSPRIEFFSLQNHVRPSDNELASWPALRHFGEQLDAGPTAGFTDTAALCTLMDIVISVDTSIAHLSAAINRPTWLLLSHVPDWRWLLEGTHSAWYPSMTLYRQGQERSWEPVLELVASDLRRLI